MGHKRIAVLLALWLLLVMPVTVLAAEFDMDRVGSISVTLMEPEGNKPMEGAELSLYHVAEVRLNSENNLSYTFTDEFENCGCPLDDPDLSGKLELFVQAEPVEARRIETDANGTAAFTELPLGLYFVRQTNNVAGYAPCTSFLVTLPHHGSEGYVYDVNASPKTDVVKLTDISIRKVWNTDASTKAAESVTVRLLRDGAVIETAVLNEENNWQVVYTDLPESDGYSIVEVNVPKGFTATYTQNGYVFTVTNTAALIQPGQLVWPIPVLAMAGLCLIAVGTMVLRRTRDENE